MNFNTITRSFFNPAPVTGGVLDDLGESFSSAWWPGGHFPPGTQICSKFWHYSAPNWKSIGPACETVL